MKQSDPSLPAPESPEALAAMAPEIWAEVAGRVGWPASGCHVHSLKLYCSPVSVRGVFRVTHPDGRFVVLKLDLLPQAPERFRRQIENTRRAGWALARFPQFGVPDILWSDAGRGVTVQSFIPGDTGRRALAWADYGIGARDDLLRRIGQYAGALHRSTAEASIGFSARHYLRGVRGRAAALRAAQLALPRPKRFLGLCAYLHRAARRCSGAELAICQTHGDFHLLNLIVSDASITAIDFSFRPPAPALRDLSRFWLSSGGAFDLTDGQQAGLAGLPAQDLAAFEDGYGRLLTADPAFPFFLAYQIYLEWSKFAARPAGLTSSEQAQLRRYVKMLEALLLREGSE